MFERRALVITMLAGLVSPARAQPVRKPKVGALFVQSSTGPLAENQHVPFRAEMARLGWIDGETVEFIERFAQGDLSRLPALAMEIVTAKPEVIFSHTGVAVRILRQATSVIPIVAGPAAEDDLVALAGDQARPRANLTGISFVSREMHEKLIELLVQAHPGAKRIAVLVDSRLNTYRDYPAPLVPALSHLGVSLVRLESAGPEGIDAAFDTLRGIAADAVVVMTMPGFNIPPIARAIAARANAINIALAGAGEFYAREGGLLAFGPDYITLVRRGAAYVDRILRGAKVADLPIERPTLFKLVVNKVTATRLGVTIPPAILLRADEVIE